MLNPQKRVWATLITNLFYLPGLLTLHHSLQETGTHHPFIAFHTLSFPASCLRALHARGIKTHLLSALSPAGTRPYEQDPRFRETWTKLLVFGAEEYERVVLLDGDMLVRRNMDWLMDDTADGHGVPANCAYTPQHTHPTRAQTHAPSPTSGVGMLNSGLLVITPSKGTYAQIEAALREPARVERYTFPDQELLSDVFYGRWVPLPYVYNALKTMRGEAVHGAIWRDDEVRNVHYIFARKPWDEPLTRDSDEMDRLWWETNARRQWRERELGIVDGF